MASKKKVITIGISGASCSGKTTLARLLQQILPNSKIFYQDDFFKPQKDVPVDAPTNLVNWDCPEAINFSDFIETLQQLRKTGFMPATFESKEYRNIRQEIKGVELESLIENLSLEVRKVLGDVGKVLQENKILVREQNDVDKINGSDIRKFNGNINEQENNEWCFVIVDGFLLYQDVQVVNELDVKLFIKADYETLKKRREERNSYFTLEGNYWIDPPNYFDSIVWPEYVKYYNYLLSRNKEIGSTINDLIVLESVNKQQIKENIEKIVMMTLKVVEKSNIYNNIKSSNEGNRDNFENFNAKLNNTKSGMIEIRKKEESSNGLNNEIPVYS
ncbi:4532_t:CDS:2 [Acaulospora morrowiae]|uniref:4532_t:CDS:1 n=1 Tax=Acaulospora morrowiae TaxID=94023 RepID=A0A9N9CJ55_9GLOM|nr:4532_t:CDS:2 [Acaulospora morrowiae]